MARTTIEIDDELMAEAQRASGLSSKKATVEEGLRLLNLMRDQAEVLKLAGKVHWTGDLEVSRTGRC
jgi:Arc/MetJ family transcription regulator